MNKKANIKLTEISIIDQQINKTNSQLNTFQKLNKAIETNKKS